MYINVFFLPASITASIESEKKWFCFVQLIISCRHVVFNIPKNDEFIKNGIRCIMFPSLKKNIL